MTNLTQKTRNTLNDLFKGPLLLAFGFLDGAVDIQVGDWLYDLFASAGGAVSSLLGIPANISFQKEVNHNISVDATTTTNGNGGNLSLRAGAKNGSGVDGVVKVGDLGTSEVDIGSTAGKIALYGVTAVVQPQGTAVTTAGFVAGAGAPVLVDSTFTGGTGTAAYHLSDVVLALKQLGALKA